MKLTLRGQRFNSAEEINRAVTDSLSVMTKVGEQDGIDGLVRHWQKCVELDGA
jgi:hypothetical protein